MARDPRKCTSAKALLEDGYSHAGFVVKEGGRFRSMRTRYFILHKGCLYYFKDFKSVKEQGSFCILGYSIEENNEDTDIFGIRLVCPEKRSFYFVVSTKEEQQSWISKLNEEIEAISGKSGSSNATEPNAEPYDYAYQRSMFSATDEHHNYEETDCATIPQKENNNVSPLKKTPYSSHVPKKDKPPAIPERCTKPNTIGNPGLTKFMPVDVSQSRTFPRTAITNQNNMSPNVSHNTKPKPPAPQKPKISSKPPVPVSSKPFFQMGIGNQEDAFKLQQKLKTRAKSRESYEVQTIKSKPEELDKQGDSDSSDSEGYLDLEGEGDDFFKKRASLSRQRPAGRSTKSDNTELYEKPVSSPIDHSDKSVLPLSVFQDSLSRATAEDILKNINQEGMYLIRKGRTGLQVITVYVQGECKHYQIFEKNDDIFLQEDEPYFKSLVDLVRHYLGNNLPTCPRKLVQPYS